nr:hypothetical protein [uncultured Pseudomonas sp.]
MKSFAARVSVLLVLWLASACVLATSLLAFEGDGYWIDLEIGADPDPVVASVRFHKPGDAKGVALPGGEWRVEAFDSQRQILVLSHKAGSSEVEPFTLSVKGRRATLALVGRKIDSLFSWDQ